MGKAIREPEVHRLEIESGRFVKLAKGMSLTQSWKGNGVHAGDYLLLCERDPDTDELTGRTRLASVTEVQKSGDGHRGIEKGWAMLSVLVVRPPRTI